MFETAINDAAKGRALVTVIPFDQRGKYLAVYTQRP
jgi:acyl-CoA thioesterase